MKLNFIVAAGIFITLVSCNSSGGGSTTEGISSTISEFSGGQAHTCYISSDGKVKCWGLNLYGQLGLGDTLNRSDEGGESITSLAEVDLGTGHTAKKVVAGYYHTCAILDDDSVKCWGDNDVGQLGLGDTNNRGDDANEMGDNLPTVDLGTGRSALDLSIGRNFTCALLDNSTVKCWGDNFLGMLGRGDTNQVGDLPNQMGDNLAPIDLGTGRTAKFIASRGIHACAILDNDSLKCWGANSNGGLGLDDTNNRGDNGGEMGDALPAIDLGSGRSAVKVSMGNGSTCALLDNGTVKCWGYNLYGQLGIGDISDRGNAPGEMGDSLPTVDLGSGRTATDLISGRYFSCALLDNSDLKCWGNNDDGNLGQNNTSGIGNSGGQMGDALLPIDLGLNKTASKITAGDYHVCVLLNDGHGKCWGFNSVGQLGLEDTNNRGDEAGEMGDNLPAIDE